MRAGKHVMIEIPMADSLADSERLVQVQKETGVVAMAGHTRRFNPSHQWIHKRVVAGELKVLQMDVQTYFFRRTNTNALGKPRSWTDHLLWHHACHTVDLVRLSDGRERIAGLCAAGAEASGVGNRDGHEHRTEGRHPARSARCRSPSTTMDHWERSFATSAITARISHATMNC